jgi:serine/threonine-protein kinase
MAEPGDLIAGRYRLDELIARGGMASVYRAWDVPLDRPVAVKLLRPEILADPDLALRFRREAHAATVLRHPNVVACLDTGTAGDEPYLVMDLIEGEDLSARLRRDGRLPLAEAVRIATDVARGLGVAHARGIVHRDVKPGNILLGSDGVARVTDFGIARLAAEAEVTLPGTTLGSVHWFSPEQARGASTTPASDVYSLGLVLFEMLTGTRPFGGETPAQIALARVDAPAPSPRAVDPAIPESLDALVRRALAPDPRDRQPNAGALAAELEGLVRPADETTRVPLHPSGVAAPVGGTPGESFWGQTRGRSAGRTGGWIVVGLVVVGIAVLLGATGLSLLGLAGNGAIAGAPSDGAATPGTTSPPLVETDPPAAATEEPPPVTPPPTRRPDGTFDLCQPTGDTTCPLEPGPYAPSVLVPAVAFELGEGWGALFGSEQLIVLARPEGYLALAGNVRTIFDEDEPETIDGRANRVSDAIRKNEALRVVERERVEIDGRRGDLLDVEPDGDERVPVFATGDNTYFAEVGTVTRFIVVDVDDVPVIIVVEGANGFGLEAILESAGPVLDSLRFR